MVARYLASETYHIEKKLQRWVEAFLAIDAEDKAPLIKLLKSNTPIPALARLYLVDLLERKNLRNAKHPSTPLYRYSDRVSKRLRAVKAVRYLRKYEHLPLDDAITQAALIYNLNPNVVRAAWEGKDRACTRMAKQRPHLKASFDRP